MNQRNQGSYSSGFCYVAAVILLLAALFAPSARWTTRLVLLALCWVVYRLGNRADIMSMSPISRKVQDARRNILDKRISRWKKLQGKIIPAIFFFYGALDLLFEFMLVRRNMSNTRILIGLVLAVVGFLMFKTRRGKPTALEKRILEKLELLLEINEKTPLTDGPAPSSRTSASSSSRSAAARQAPSGPAPVSRPSAPAQPRSVVPAKMPGVTAPSLSQGNIVRQSDTAAAPPQDRETELKELVNAYEQNVRQSSPAVSWKGQHILAHRQLHHAAVQLFPGSYLLQTREGIIQMLVWAGSVLPCLRAIVDTPDGSRLLAGEGDPEQLLVPVIKSLDSLAEQADEKATVRGWADLDPESLMAGWEALQCFGGRAEAAHLRIWAEKLARVLESRDDAMEQITAKNDGHGKAGDRIRTA